MPLLLAQQYQGDPTATAKILMQGLGLVNQSTNSAIDDAFRASQAVISNGVDQQKIALQQQAQQQSAQQNALTNARLMQDSQLRQDRYNNELQTQQGIDQFNRSIQNPNAFTNQVQVLPSQQAPFVAPVLPSGGATNGVGVLPPKPSGDGSTVDVGSSDPAASSDYQPAPDPALGVATGEMPAQTPPPYVDPNNPPLPGPPPPDSSLQGGDAPMPIPDQAPAPTPATQPQQADPSIPPEVSAAPQGPPISDYLAQKNQEIARQQQIVSASYSVTGKAGLQVQKEQQAVLNSLQTQRNQLLTQQRQYQTSQARIASQDSNAAQKAIMAPLQVQKAAADAELAKNKAAEFNATADARQQKIQSDADAAKSEAEIKRQKAANGEQGPLLTPAQVTVIQSQKRKLDLDIAQNQAALQARSNFMKTDPGYLNAKDDSTRAMVLGMMEQTKVIPKAKDQGWQDQAIKERAALQSRLGSATPIGSSTGTQGNPAQPPQQNGGDGTNAFFDGIFGH